MTAMSAARRLCSFRADSLFFKVRKRGVMKVFLFIKFVTFFSRLSAGPFYMLHNKHVTIIFVDKTKPTSFGIWEIII